MSPDHEVTPETKADMLLRFGYYITIVFFRVEKLPHFLASHNLKMKLEVVKTSSDHSGQRKIRKPSVFLVLIFLLFQNFCSSVECQLLLHLLVS